MAIVKADTVNFEELITDFDICVQTYIQSVDSLYKLINGMSAWKGKAQMDYLDRFALIKQYDKTISIFENKKLDKWVHNKSIQKCIESYRISNERKSYLRELKIK